MIECSETSCCGIADLKFLNSKNYDVHESVTWPQLFKKAVLGLCEETEVFECDEEQRGPAHVLMSASYMNRDVGEWSLHGEKPYKDWETARKAIKRFEKFVEQNGLGSVMVGPSKQNPSMCMNTAIIPAIWTVDQEGLAGYAYDHWPHRFIDEDDWRY